MRLFVFWAPLSLLFLFAPACSKSSPDPGSSGGTTKGSSKGTLTPKGSAVTDSTQTGDSGSGRAPNVLLLIADDLGVDVLKSSGFTKTPAITPTLDKLASTGLVFENFWVTPACTTTRGALISGQHGFSSGIDFVPAIMADSTPTLQQRLKQGDVKVPYATGVFGKWHLGGPKADPAHPGRFGIDQYAGNLFNLDDYDKWTLTQNGQQSESTEYHTTKVVDLARDFIASQPSDKPWFAWVAFAAPHSPFHAPPASLVSAAPNDNAPSQYRAMVESMDTEIGRLVNGISSEILEHTLIIFLGDNGTPILARDREMFAKDHVKGSIYEGGIRAPLIVSGGPVKRKGQRETALVNATDVFATVVDLASTAAVPQKIPTNSLSFAPLFEKSGTASRSFNYAEWKVDGDLFWAVRDDKHKAIQFSDGTTALYATSDLSETNALTDDATLNRLLDFGKKLREGTLSPGKTGSGGSFCSDHAGTRTHEIRDVNNKKSLAGEVTIRVNGEKCEISTNGIPDHDVNDAQSSFPKPVSEQDFDLKVPLNPQASQATTPLTLDTDNGVLLNGAKIDMIAAACYGIRDGKIGCNDMNQPWRFDPMFAANGFGVDSHFAHTQPTGAYHYHGVSAALDTKGVIGVAADGFPIHSATISVQGIDRTLRSSYRLRQGNRVQSNANAPFPGGSYDGTFRDDWEYVPGHGDLDECNGATINGSYMYFATVSYPYFMGCFRGTPDPSFKKRGPRAMVEHAHGGHQHHYH